MQPETDPRLLVGADTADDAGVYQISDDLALIQTLDFFTPIVNDPYLFGQIAATNALSDVFAMGGLPITAMNICCFPVKEYEPEVFSEILKGGLDKVHEAGAVLAGGHSVEDPELKYGLSVTGLVHPDKITTNAGLKADQVLILTKPLGTGVIATALKAGLASPQAVTKAVELMTQLNRTAAEVMQAFGVSGATDVTGFGLLGHALEMAKASKLGLVVNVPQVPVLEEAKEMASMGLVPLGSHANRQFCEKSIILKGEVDTIGYDLMADAQTSGGLLFGVDQDKVDKALVRLKDQGIKAEVIGSVTTEHPGQITLAF